MNPKQDPPAALLVGNNSFKLNDASMKLVVQRGLQDILSLLQRESVQVTGVKQNSGIAEGFTISLKAFEPPEIEEYPDEHSDEHSDEH